MAKTDEDEERDERIRMEIVVDAYDRHERAIGWYTYLDEKMDVPFEARCIEKREVSPLEEGEAVRVVGMPPETDCRCEMFVLVEWLERELGVPLVQLEPQEEDGATREAIADWHYWVRRGHKLC